ncbi:MAG: TIGR01212 family radical SAM protein [Lachnospiraceae bacterium]|nr:TIGR01212 family radical SAM protein [Lachnospiraceae bacterium]
MTYHSLWLDKPYYSLNAYFKHTFGEKCYKIALDGGCTCPNRDGTLDTRGCIFCSGSGSGDFSTPVNRHQSISEQIAHGLSLMGNKKTGNKFVAYFQAFTNTYGPINRLRTLYTEALNAPEIIGLSIATRPDCLGEEVLNLLKELKLSYPDKFIWVELGLQTIHEATACYIRRGYPLPVFDKAAQDLHRLGIPFIVHIILGLPGENKNMLLQTVDYLNTVKPFGVKLQLLHILKGTDLAAEYAKGHFEALSEEAYFDLLGACIGRLHPGIVLHRVTGDGPKNLLIAPLWSADKRGVLNRLHHYLKLNNIYQGRDFHDTRTVDII